MMVIKGRIALIEEPLSQCHFFTKYRTCNVAIWKPGLRDDRLANNCLWQGTNLGSSQVLLLLLLLLLLNAFFTYHSVQTSPC